MLNLRIDVPMTITTTYDDFSIKELISQIDDQRISLPRYQRDVVWPPDKKRRLIDSVLNGFPIGSLLLAEVEDVTDGVARKTFRIIDGLQRTSTFRSYLAEPEKIGRAHV